MDSIAYDYEYEAAAGRLRPIDAGKLRSSPATERGTVLRRLLLSSDLLAGALGGLIASLAFGLTSSQALSLTAGLTGSLVLFAFVFGLYSDGDIWSWASGLNDAPRAAVAGLLLSWATYVLASILGLDHPALVALVGTVATAGTDTVARALARGVAHRRAPLRQRTVIVGSGLVADRLADRLQRHSEFGLDAIGIVDDDVYTLGGTQRLPKLGSLEQLDEVLDDAEVDRVIIAFSRAGHQELLNCIRACRDRRIAVDVVPRLFELLDGARSLNQIGGLPLISIGAPPLTRTGRVAKRILDIVGSTVAIVALSPVLIAVAIAIKATSRGPVVFSQVRAGRGGHTFRLFKFRSMYRDADDRKRLFDEQNDANDGVMFKIKQDPRITPVGRFLRKTSLDELPQLINIFAGEMSLVGPRPLPVEDARYYEEWQWGRLAVLPGLTGLWQVSGRSDLPFQEMVSFDYQYVSGWSLARDIEILLATVPAVLSGRGAY